MKALNIITAVVAGVAMIIATYLLVQYSKEQKAAKAAAAPPVAE